MKRSNKLFLSVILAMGLLPMGKAFGQNAVPSPNPTSLNMDRIFEAARRAQDQNKPDEVEFLMRTAQFMDGLKVYNQLGDNNVIFWRPRFHIDVVNGGSMMIHPDVEELNKNIDSLNQKASAVLTSQQGLAFKSVNDAFDAQNVFLPENETQSQSIVDQVYTADPLLLKSSDNVLNSFLRLLTPKQQEVWGSSVLWYAMAAGVDVPDGVDTNKVKMIVQEIKKMDAGTFSVGLRTGFNLEEYKYIVKYRELYSEYRWIKLDSDNPVKVTIDIPTDSNIDGNEQVNMVQSPSIFVAANMINGISASIPLSDTSLHFNMSYAGIKALLKKQAKGEGYILPIKFNQTVNVPYQLEGRVVCKLSAQMKGEISFKSEKYHNTDSFSPVDMQIPKNIDSPSNYCKFITNENTVPTSDKKTLMLNTLALYEKRFKEEFAIKKEASEKLKDEMLDKMLFSAAQEFDAYFPEKQKSYLVEHVREQLSTQCSTEIKKTCTTRLFGACLKKTISTSNYCSTERKLIPFYIRHYYTERMPMYQFKQQNIDKMVNVEKEYQDFGNDVYTGNYPIADGLCFKFYKDGDSNSQGLGGGCDQNSVQSAKEDRQKEDYSKHKIDSI